MSTANKQGPIELTSAEAAYVAEQRIARIATRSEAGEPDVAAVFCVYRPDPGEFVIGGMVMERTRKFHNIVANGRASVVFDDIASASPYQPRGIKVTGSARIERATEETKLTEANVNLIFVVPERKWSWGIEAVAFSDYGAFDLDVNGERLHLEKTV